MENNIKAMLTFEMLGKPEKYLEESMTKFVETFSLEKDLKVINKNVYPTKKVENKDSEGNLITQGELFSTFAEIEIEIKDILSLILLTFRFMPSHLEIESPTELRFKNNELNVVLGELIGRLHQYDSIAKSAIMNNQGLKQKLIELMDKQKDKDVDATEAPKKESSEKKKKSTKNSKKK